MTNPPTDESGVTESMFYAASRAYKGVSGVEPKPASLRAALDAALSHQGEVVKSRCPYCDDTGDVHSIDGEWRGSCDCCKVVKASDLQGLCDEWENMKVPHSASSYELGMFDGYRGAQYDLTALISKAEKV